MIETLAQGYSSESTQGELSNEYQHDRVKMGFTNLCILVFWTKVASALDGIIMEQENVLPWKNQQLALGKALATLSHASSENHEFLFLSLFFKVPISACFLPERHLGLALSCHSAPQIQWIGSGP